jgi:hypothetical protein
MLDETLGLRRNRDKTCTACLRGTGVRRDFLGFTVRGIAVDRVASGGT